MNHIKPPKSRAVIKKTAHPIGIPNVNHIKPFNGDTGRERKALNLSLNLTSLVRSVR